MGVLDFLTGGVGSILGGLFTGAGNAFAATQSANAARDINAQNIALSNQQFAAQQQLAQQQIGLQTWGAEGNFMPNVADNILHMASQLGVNPVTLAGASPSTPSFSASVGGGLPSLNVPEGSGIGGMLKGLGQGVSGLAESASKVDDLKSQLLGLQIDSTKADIIHKNLINSNLALAAQPGNAQGNGVPLPQPDPRFETDVKPALQKFQTSSGIVVMPSRSFTESSFSAIPGVPGSVVVGGDTLNQIPNPTVQVRPGIDRWFQNLPAGAPIGNPMGDQY